MWAALLIPSNCSCTFSSNLYVTELKDHILFDLSETFNSLFFYKNSMCFLLWYCHILLWLCVFFFFLSWLADLFLYLLCSILIYSSMKFLSLSKLYLRHSSLITLYFLLGLSCQHTWFKYMHNPKHLYLELCHFILIQVCIFKCLPYTSTWICYRVLKLTKSNTGLPQRVKNLPAMQDIQIWSLGWEDPLEKDMATHFNILVWKIPWREKPGGLQSTGLKSVKYDWLTKT